MVAWAFTRWRVAQATPAPPEPQEADEEDAGEAAPTVTV